MFGSMLMSSNNADLTDGLVAYYKLAGDAVDETGNYDGVYYSTGVQEYSDPVYGAVISFDGTDGFIYSNIALSSPSVVTYSFWYNINSNGDYYPLIVGSEELYEVYHDDNDDNALIVYENGNGNMMNEYAIIKDVWAHAIIEIKANEQTLWIDDIHKQTLVEAFGMNDMSGFSMGGYSDGTHSMNGYLRHVRVYDKALDAATRTKIHLAES